MIMDYTTIAFYIRVQSTRHGNGRFDDDGGDLRRGREKEKVARK